MNIDLKRQAWSNSPTSPVSSLWEGVHYRCGMFSPSRWVLTAVSAALWPHCLAACSVALQPAAGEITPMWVTVRRTPQGSSCHNWMWSARSYYCFPELQDKSAWNEADHQPVPFLPGPQQTRSKPRLSTTVAIPSASSPSDLLPGGQIPALHLHEWSSAHRQRAICKKDWISSDSVQESKKDSFWMRWWNPLDFQKPSVVVLFRAGLKRTWMLLTESMACSFYYVSVHSLQSLLNMSQVHHEPITVLQPLWDQQCPCYFIVTIKNAYLLVQKKRLEFWTWPTLALH